MSEQRAEGTDVMRADPRSKRRAYVLIAALIVAGALLKLLGLPALMRWLAVSDNAVLLHRVTLVFDALAALMLALAVFVGWHASRILRSNQSPPPNTWVLRDTPIVRGGVARLRGWVVMACAVAFVVLAVYAALLPARLNSRVVLSKSRLAPKIELPASAHPTPTRPEPVAPHPHPNPSSLPIAKPHG